eukprot:gene1021-2618_t
MKEYRKEVAAGVAGVPLVSDRASAPPPPMLQHSTSSAGAGCIHVILVGGTLCAGFEAGLLEGEHRAKMEPLLCFSGQIKYNQLVDSSYPVIMILSFPGAFLQLTDQLLGRGAFGAIYLGIDKSSGLDVAVRAPAPGFCAVKKLPVDSEETALEIEKEVRLLSQLGHENIIQYYGSDRQQKEMLIILEYAPGGSLAALLSKMGTVPFKMLQKILSDSLKGLAYLHSMGIVHRDIKPQNILSLNGCYKLADFGCAAVLQATGDVTTSTKGTGVAPEACVPLSGETGKPADMYAIGMTVIHLVSGRQPWAHVDLRSHQLMYHILHQKDTHPIPAGVPDSLRHMIVSVIQFNPAVRPTAEALLKHQFFESLVDPDDQLTVTISAAEKDRECDPLDTVGPSEPTVYHTDEWQ